MQGGWTGVAVALAGGVLFTIGSMSHDRTNAGQESKAPFTLAAAAIAAALSRVFYDRAVIGVFGKVKITTLHCLMGSLVQCRKGCIAAALFWDVV